MRSQFRFARGELINFKKCLRCQAPVEPLSPPLCQCSNVAGSKMHTLRATGEKVEDVAGTDNRTEMAILKALAIKKNYINDKNEIVYISR